MVKATGSVSLEDLAAQGGGGKAGTGTQDRIPDPEFLQLEDIPVSDAEYQTRVKVPEKKASTKRVRSTAADRTADDIASTLEEKFSTIFMLLGGVAPVTSVYGSQNADRAVSALMDIGKRRPAVMRALLRVADGADGLELGKFAVGIVVALQVDLGRIEPDAIAARATGVTEVIEMYFGEQAHASAEQTGHNGIRFETL